MHTRLVNRAQPRESDPALPERKPGEIYTASGPFVGTGMPYNLAHRGCRMQAFQYMIIGGLDTALFDKDGDTIVALGASNYDAGRSDHGEIYLGERVKLQFSKGHPTLYSGDQATIVKLGMPFNEHRGDDIIQVQTASGSMGWVKPGEIEKLVPFNNPLDAEKSIQLRPIRIRA